jgi:cell division transport system permease protein
MNLAVLSTELRHGLRNVRQGGLPFFFATLMTGLGLFGLAVFAMVLQNFNRISENVGERVGAVAFLNVDDSLAAEEIRASVSFLPGVQEARLVTPEAALERARRALGESGTLIDQTAGIRMPWTVEIAFDLAAGVTIETVLAAVRATTGVDEVLHPSTDIARIDALSRVMHGAGIFLIVLVAFVTLLVVSNTVKLTLFARREEIAIMKLVGATDIFVRVPFIFEGFVEGVLGGILAFVGAMLAHATLAGVLQLALSGPFGTFTLEPLPAVAGVWLVVTGALLGMVGAGISIGRFLKV